MKVYYTLQYEGSMETELWDFPVLDDCGHDAIEVEISDKLYKEYIDAKNKMAKIQAKIDAEIFGGK